MCATSCLGPRELIQPLQSRQQERKIISVKLLFQILSLVRTMLDSDSDIRQVTELGSSLLFLKTVETWSRLGEEGHTVAEVLTIVQKQG